jgi:hypothetical protein
MFKASSDALLLELEGEQMDHIEDICRKKGISYEQAIKEMQDADLAQRNSAESEREDDPAQDWWKKS